MHEPAKIIRTHKIQRQPRSLLVMLRRQVRWLTTSGQDSQTTDDGAENGAKKETHSLRCPDSPDPISLQRPRRPW